MSRLSSKNQVTIPAAVLREADLSPGDDLRISAVAPGRLVVTRSDVLVEELAGQFDSETFPAGYLDALRDEWES